MRVQSIDNQNGKAFGIRKIELDDSLEDLSESTLRAIKGAIEKETYGIGDKKTDIFMFTKPKEQDNIGPVAKDNYYLYTRAQKAGKKFSVINDFPETQVNTTEHVIKNIRYAVSKLYENMESASSQILKSAQDLTEKFNPKTPAAAKAVKHPTKTK